MCWDAGFATHVDEVPSGADSHDKKAKARGSLDYFAPESVYRKIAPSADVWAVRHSSHALEREREVGRSLCVSLRQAGVIAYSILYGSMPFDGGDETTVLQKIMTEEPPYTTRVR